MDEQDGELPQHAFKPTRWTLVINTRGEGKEADQALADLCESYWFPLYAFARRSNWNAADAEDLVQGFFIQLIEKKLFDSADQEKGKLRTFLLTAFRRFAKDEAVKRNAAKRGGNAEKISFDYSEAESWYSEENVEGETPEQLFDRQWALTLVEKALDSVESYCESRGKGEEFQLMKPLLLDETSGDDFSRVGAALGITPNAAKIQIHRLRSRFRETLRAEIRETQLDEGDEEGEIRYLMSQLSRSA